LADGFELYSETVIPAKVRVRGPASFIKTLDFVSTDKIDLTGRSSDFTAKQVAINVANAKATVLETVADVVFRIGEKRVERVFRVPIAGERPAKSATVVLFGPRSVLQTLKAGDLRVEMVRSDTGDEIPQLTLPPGSESVEIRRIKAN
jgi:YbbR domain-containing protein